MNVGFVGVPPVQLAADPILLAIFCVMALVLWASLRFAFSQWANGGRLLAALQLSPFCFVSVSIRVQPVTQMTIGLFQRAPPRGLHAPPTFSARRTSVVPLPMPE